VINQRCKYCDDFGYVQVYRSRVMRVYCDCSAGDKRVKEVRDSLVEMGLNPDNSSFQWLRRSQVRGEW